MLIPPAILVLIGIFLAWRGLRGIRRGTEPRCRRCDYNLSGQIEQRCPECGTPFSDKTVAHGERRRSPGRIMAGAICLAVASTLALPGVRQYIQRTWQRESIHYLPTFVLIHRLKSAKGEIRWQAMEQLRLRIHSGYLTRPQIKAAADALFATEFPDAAQGWFNRRNEQLVGEFLHANVLSVDQKRRFFGVWLPAEYLPFKRPFLSQRIIDHHRSCTLPGLVPETTMWLLQIDGVQLQPLLLPSSKQFQTASHFIPESVTIQHSLTVRSSTTWYSPEDSSASGQQDRRGVANVESPLRVLCRLVKDVRYDRPKVWTDKYRPEEWSQTILAEGEDPATMPAP